jgi:hypothetical protein
MWSSQWNENWQGKPKYSEKTCLSATLSTTNPTWPDLGSNPGRRHGKPANNCLNYDTALPSYYETHARSVSGILFLFLPTILIGPYRIQFSNPLVRVCMTTFLAIRRHTSSDSKVRELATVCLPLQRWTETSVWFDDVGISSFHSCVVVDQRQLLSEWRLLLFEYVLVCRRENVGAWIRAANEHWIYCQI